jgi:hypothetical protein
MIMNSATEPAQDFTPVTPRDVIEEDRAPAADGHDAEPAESGNIDKIREIIFGGQMRDYEKRFKLLEARLIQESVDLREDTRNRLEILETYIKRELDALSERLQAEQHSREESTQGTFQALNDASRALEAKHASLEGNHARAQRDLRDQILDQSKTLRDEIRQKHEDISSALNREVAGLNDQKTSRSDLASMFGELAMRLNDLKSLNQD